MTQLKLSKMISEQSIQDRIQVLGKEISEKFKGQKLTAICVLKGSFIFYADLIRAVQMDVQCEFFGVSSYHGGTSSSGEVNLTLDLSRPVTGENLLLIEDIVDTGLTMEYLIRNLLARKPKSLTTVSLLYKPNALKVPLKLDYHGFEISNEFVVGYGLDYQGFYRNLPYIAQVQNMN